MRFLLLTILFSSYVFSQPNWYKTQTHPKYPKEFYILGIGAAVGEDARETAKQNAIADVASQIKVQVQSEITSLEKERIINKESDYYSEFQQKSKTIVDEILTGCEIVEMDFDKKAKTWYALAVLDKQRYLASLEDEIENAWMQIKKLYEDAQSFIGAGKVLQAIQNLKDAQQKIYDIYSKQVFYNALSKIPYKPDVDLTASGIESEIRDLISRIKIEKVSGDNQVGRIGEELPEELVVKVFYQGNVLVPIVNANVVFTYKTGEVIERTTTNEQGIASIKAIAMGKRANQIIASFSIPGLPSEYARIISQIKAEFTYTTSAEMTPSVTVSLKGAKEDKLIFDVMKKLTQAIEKNGYKVEDEARFVVGGDIGSRVVSSVQGVGGMLYTVEAELNLFLKDLESGQIIGSMSVKSRAVGKSERDAYEKALKGMKFSNKELVEMLSNAKIEE
ncbi:LPP20 family lipoprotein [Candidatus Kryptobacter tengchongensis]|uniref:LPP20 family lipoprotein n=1 Tax=Kryptobacter tengchongensis TaxID=1643429 RepID=UPI000707ADEC|nr:LPP20 family lipoprotein [Candidatus Kryptobacter tengchongensis]CUS85686.1 LPP20 lipoprotein [Candidatus Kryptobacter tengchongensis]CUU04391.1 LPP20 lipoprotein [Candidatus Kryptobacter tengchongensis]